VSCCKVFAYVYLFKQFNLGTQALVRTGSPNSSLSADEKAGPIFHANVTRDSSSNIAFDHSKFKV
jgi:hypothetical protein